MELTSAFNILVNNCPDLPRGIKLAIIVTERCGFWNWENNTVEIDPQEAEKLGFNPIVILLHECGHAACGHTIRARFSSKYEEEEASVEKEREAWEWVFDNYHHLGLAYHDIKETYERSLDTYYQSLAEAALEEEYSHIEYLERKVSDVAM